MRGKGDTVGDDGSARGGGAGEAPLCGSAVRGSDACGQKGGVRVRVRVRVRLRLRLRVRVLVRVRIRVRVRVRFRVRVRVRVRVLTAYRRRRRQWWGCSFRGPRG